MLVVKPSGDIRGNHAIRMTVLLENSAALASIFAPVNVDDLIVRDETGGLYLYPFRNDTFYNNGGGTQVGNGFNFTDYFVGNWTEH